jgi:hypothetical protein
MVRLLLTTAFTILMASPALAGNWADALFAGHSHDFGVVARGPTLSHSFRITNTTAQPVHLANVRVSCGCTSAAAQTSELAPGQSTDLVVNMDTRRFYGHKAVTVYVQFDRPQWEEVRLTVSATSRDEIALSPQLLSFGSIVRGTNATRATTLTVHGLGTHLVSIQAQSNYVQMAARNVRHTETELVYEITATLRPDTPIGKWYTDIWLNLSGPNGQQMRLPLTVEVTPALQLSASVLSFGNIEPSEKSEKRIIVRGPQPFRITGIEGTDEVVSVQPPGDEAKPVHVLVVGVKPTKSGEFARTLKVVTDLEPDRTVELPIKASVTMPKAD